MKTVVMHNISGNVRTEYGFGNNYLASFDWCIKRFIWRNFVSDWLKKRGEKDRIRKEFN